MISIVLYNAVIKYVMSTLIVMKPCETINNRMTRYLVQADVIDIKGRTRQDVNNSYM